MGLLLRLLERRCIAAAVILLAAVAAASRWREAALDLIDFRLHPPADAVSPLGADLLKDVDARESARLRGLHRAVSVEIQAARSAGFDVDNLQRLADSALLLDTAIYRSAAVERLNKLRLVIPRKTEGFRPASGDEESAEPAESPRPRRAVRRP